MLWICILESEERVILLSTAFLSMVGLLLSYCNGTKIVFNHVNIPTASISSELYVLEKKGHTERVEDRETQRQSERCAYI